MASVQNVRLAPLLALIHCQLYKSCPGPALVLLVLSTSFANLAGRSRDISKSQKRSRSWCCVANTWQSFHDGGAGAGGGRQLFSSVPEACGERAQARRRKGAARGMQRHPRLAAGVYRIPSVQLASLGRRTCSVPSQCSKHFVV